MGRTQKVVSTAADKPKNPAAVSLGRRGGLKGGPARAAKLSPEERKAIAQQAAKQRWAREKEKTLQVTADQTVASKVAASLP